MSAETGDTIYDSYGKDLYKIVENTSTTLANTVSGTTVVATKTAGTITTENLVEEINNTDVLENITAVDVVSDSLDTQAATIIGAYTFGASGAIQIGTYSNGVSGDIRISPSGIVGRDATGANTFTIDGTTGSATYAGTVAVSQLTAGTITSKEIVMAISAGTGDVAIKMGSSLDMTNWRGDGVVILGLDDSDSDRAKLFVGNYTNNQYLNYDGEKTTISGEVRNIKNFTAGMTFGAGYYLVSLGTDGKIYKTPNDIPYLADSIVGFTRNANKSAGDTVNVQLSGKIYAPPVSTYAGYNYYANSSSTHGACWRATSEEAKGVDDYEYLKTTEWRGQYWSPSDSTYEMITKIWVNLYAPNVSNPAKLFCKVYKLSGNPDEGMPTFTLVETCYGAHYTGGDTNDYKTVGSERLYGYYCFVLPRPMPISSSEYYAFALGCTGSDQQCLYPHKNISNNSNNTGIVYTTNSGSSWNLSSDDIYMAGGVEDRFSFWVEGIDLNSCGTIGTSPSVINLQVGRCDEDSTLEIMNKRLLSYIKASNMYGFAPEDDATYSSEPWGLGTLLPYGTIAVDISVSNEESGVEHSFSMNGDSFYIDPGNDIRQTIALEGSLFITRTSEINDENPVIKGFWI